MRMKILKLGMSKPKRRNNERVSILKVHSMGISDLDLAEGP
jgi:hypothetical protein